MMMMKDELRAKTIAALEGMSVRVEVDDQDANVLRVQRAISRTQIDDLGIVVITTAGLDLSGLHDRQVEWSLRHRADMAKELLPII